jgi:hypothetical protein
MKRCSHCKIEKPLADFHKNRAMKDRLCSSCKPCNRLMAVAAWAKCPEEHKKKTSMRGLKWARDNPERHNAIVRRTYRRSKDKVIAAYGGCCAKCGFSDWRALCIDHVNGGGGRDPDKARKRWKRIADENYPPIYQVLCANCNMIKMHENHEHPTGRRLRRSG